MPSTVWKNASQKFLVKISGAEMILFIVGFGLGVALHYLHSSDDEIGYRLLTACIVFFAFLGLYVAGDFVFSCALRWYESN